MYSFWTRWWNVNIVVYGKNCGRMQPSACVGERSRSGRVRSVARSHCWTHLWIRTQIISLSDIGSNLNIFLMDSFIRTVMPPDDFHAFSCLGLSFLKTIYPCKEMSVDWSACVSISPTQSDRFKVSITSPSSNLLHLTPWLIYSKPFIFQQLIENSVSLVNALIT